MLFDVDNITLRNCIITGNGLQTGIQLLRSSNCVISNNLIGKALLINPKIGIPAGILVQGGGLHTISGNNLTNNLVGIILSGGAGNIVVRNSIENNSGGISIFDSSNNAFYNNNFINNTIQASDGEPTSVNIWDNGETGNYWSNYTGQDINGDNVGDSPHIIYESNQDNYPLMTPLDIITIPEFPSWTILPLLMLATLAGVIYRRRTQQSY